VDAGKRTQVLLKIFSACFAAVVFSIIIHHVSLMVKLELAAVEQHVLNHCPAPLNARLGSG
jgi:hypothetical protein